MGTAGFTAVLAVEGIVFAVAMLILSNHIVSDVKETLRAEMNLGFERLSSED